MHVGVGTMWYNREEHSPTHSDRGGLMEDRESKPWVVRDVPYNTKWQVRMVATHFGVTTAQALEFLIDVALDRGYAEERWAALNAIRALPAYTTRDTEMERKLAPKSDECDPDDPILQPDTASWPAI